MRFFILPVVVFSIQTLAAISATAAEPSYLWREWYLYSVSDAPQGYYQEEAEKRTSEKQIAISQKWHEIDEGGTDTFIGSVANDDDKFTPVAFFSERNNAKRAYKLDARVKKNKIDFTFKLVKPPGVNIKKTVDLKKGMILSNFLSLALSKHDPKKGIFSFEAIVEDSRDGKFEARPGKAEMEGKTKQIAGNSCRLYNIVFEGVPSQWWITNEGKLCQVLIPQTQTQLILTTEAEAKKALGSK